MLKIEKVLDSWPGRSKDGQPLTYFGYTVVSSFKEDAAATTVAAEKTALLQKAEEEISAFKTAQTSAGRQRPEVFVSLRTLKPGTEIVLINGEYKASALVSGDQAEIAATKASKKAEIKALMEEWGLSAIEAASQLGYTLKEVM